jgi:hypothetical protein
MALGEHRREHQPDLVLLADNRQVDVVDQLAEGVGEPGGLFVSDGHVSPN